MWTWQSFSAKILAYDTINASPQHFLCNYILCQYDLFFQKRKESQIEDRKSGETTNCSAEIKHMANREYFAACLLWRDIIILNWSQYLPLKQLWERHSVKRTVWPRNMASWLYNLWYFLIINGMYFMLLYLNYIYIQVTQQRPVSFSSSLVTLHNIH